jgi:hypothetical protein
LTLARSYANCIVRRQITGEASDDGMKITRWSLGEGEREEKMEGKHEETNEAGYRTRKKNTSSGQYVFKDDKWHVYSSLL